ncbi:MAG TPA: type II toxin-antitoxin system RelE/ParE family toxin [Chloroflexia bacterium]|nr:type II toxin-antitoxin system RelE/ParE family toxin [Chloroflexia bacterium]
MEIFWTRAALADIGAACDYIDQRSPHAAELVEEHLIAAVARLADFPHLGRPGRVAGTRELVLTRLPYVVIYSVGRSRLTIVRVLHTAQARPPASMEDVDDTSPCRDRPLAGE